MDTSEIEMECQIRLAELGRGYVAMVRRATAGLVVFSHVPPFLQALAAHLHLKAGEAHAIIIASPLDPPVRSQLCGELVELMREIRAQM